MVIDIYALIQDFVAGYQKNHGTKTSWRKPIVGVAIADNPLFLKLKDIISPSHALPGELVDGAKSVIAYFVPFSENVVRSNVSGVESSDEWMAAYTDTNALLVDLNQHLRSTLEAAGFQTSNLPPTYNYDSNRLCSDWSHRSVAYIAGVGTFGINNMLITEAGSCGRIGSIVTDLEIAPTPMYDEELCLFKRDASCGACMKQCVAGAFAVDDLVVSFDRYACSTQIYEKVYPHRQIPGGDTCGKCMVGVPCSIRAPRPRNQPNTPAMGNA